MSQPPVYLYDDAEDVPHFLPFTASRPIGELRYGAWLLRERWARLGFPVRAHLSAATPGQFTEPEAPGIVARPEPLGIYLRSTFAPELQTLSLAADPGAEGVRFVDVTGATVGAAHARPREWAGGAAIPPSWPTMALRGKRLAGVWDIIADLPAALKADLELERATRGHGQVPQGCTVIGDPASLLIDEGALVEPLVVFDTRGGPIWIQDGAELRSGSRLAGSLLIGRGTKVQGGQLRESSIGPRCVVHGEMSNSLFLGYANKAHDGFLGHSIVGRWANLGAGTITSNLKNTYGTIRLALDGARIETGMQFLGALVGDHVKTAIGTMLPTGCVIGTGANLFGSRRPEASIPAFAWGTDEPGRVLACRMFLQTAGKVLPRRDVAWDEAARAYLEAVWTRCTGQPCA